MVENTQVSLLRLSYHPIALSVSQQRPTLTQSHGISERLSRAPIRTMLIHSHLSQSFGSEAYQLAIYIKNRLPHSALQHSILTMAWSINHSNRSHSSIWLHCMYWNSQRIASKPFQNISREYTKVVFFNKNLLQWSNFMNLSVKPLTPHTILQSAKCNTLIYYDSVNLHRILLLRRLRLMTQLLSTVTCDSTPNAFQTDSLQSMIHWILMAKYPN